MFYWHLPPGASSGNHRLAFAVLVPCLLVAVLGATGPRGGARATHAAPEDRGAELMACLNKGFVFNRTNWNQSIENDTPANLKVEAIWSSRRPARFELTVVTQLSFDRMPALFNQCMTYTGPIAAAVYLPLLQLDAVGSRQQTAPQEALSPDNKERVSKEVQRIGQLHAEMEAVSEACQLDLMLLWEAFDSKEAILLYPVNSLRNWARMQVKTNLMSAIDVDMMISTSLVKQLSQVPSTIQSLEQLALQKRAVVLPAFEPNRQGPYGRALADKAALGTKAELAGMVKQKSIQQFKIKVFVRGHTPTNYTKWFSTDDPYDVAYQRMYEPWYIAHTSLAPFHDANFRGYGLNKIAHVASLNYYNYTFIVYPTAWLVHRPHEDTAVRKKVAREASDVNKLGMKLPKSALYYKVTQLFGAVKRGMIRGTFTIALDPRMVQCYEHLKWLPRIPPLQGRPVDPAIFI